MSGNKGARFAVNTVIKLLVYLLICMAAYVLCGLMVGAGRHFAPPVAAAAVTWLFLRFMEGGKRSFFAKGYMLENIVPGAVIGVLTAALPMVIELLLGMLSIDGFTSGADIREPFYEVFRESLFAGIVFFGYIFHILQKDAGNICAVMVSSLLYAAFGLITLGNAEGVWLVINIKGDMDIIYILSLLLTGAAAGICIMSFGDMRSGTAFICLKKLTEIMTVMLVTVRHDGAVVRNAEFMYTEAVNAVVLGVICVCMFVSAVKKR
ncbi:MAG: hypothetical protein K2K57_06250 [Oscillospiraceae bacterium]|nr:hypothetical protein [Oscillospiraceae bacterium]